ncbi:hypothetical protein [Bradyrhizobium sp.]|uniref:hypothetical protein n=1 Tax=Bradyrhizobium sp. TaxID=376 RepID=UPI001EB4CEB9|nr:hypothetical protein [Bradyrhizobium sp.]MBV9984927.1 hypothetical protein [Bradyrhizobium sp.]
MLPFVVAQKLDQGVTNPIVARLTLQNFELLQNCAIQKETAEKIQAVYLSDLTPKLLRLSQIYEKLRADVEAKAASYKPPGKGATSVVLPQVMQLEEECRNYLYEAKNFLRDLLKIFNLLFGTSFEEASEWTWVRSPSRPWSHSPKPIFRVSPITSVTCNNFPAAPSPSSKCEMRWSIRAVSTESM